MAPDPKISRRSATSPHLATEPGPRHNLPALLTRFIGRDHEITQVIHLLGTTRLLTLTGGGGCGKTRLALRVAEQLVEDVPAGCGQSLEDGVFFVDLAPISDPGLVIPTIARTLGLREAGERRLIERLHAYLRDRQQLLLLDNFEHVLPAVPLLAELLAACPRLKLLVTSRAPLHLRGEQEFPVTPLALPEAKLPADPEMLIKSEAVALFVERARAVRPDFQLTSENASAVAEICARLDGLPLAIELAVARIKMLPPLALLARLERRLDLLTDGARDLPARQRTLRSTIEWSYELLSREQKALFHRLAIFAGSFTLEAAEVVAGDHGDGAPHECLSLGPRAVAPDTVLDGLAALIDQSLLREMESTAGEAHLTPRFVMLETVREYGLERLAATEGANESEAIRRRHATYYLALAQAAETKLVGSEQGAWLDRLEREHNNLRAAIRWSLGSGEVDTSLKLTGALWRFWFMRGYLSEGRRWLEAALAAAGDVLASSRAKALNAAGVLAHYQGDLGRAAALCGQSLRMYRHLDDKAGIAAALNGLALITRSAGNFAAARTMYAESLAIYRQLDDPAQIAYTLVYWGLAACFQGDYAAARDLSEEGRAIYQRLGNRRGLGSALMCQSIAALGQGDYPAARELSQQSLTIFTSFGDRRAMTRPLSYLAEVALQQQDYAQARALYDQALAILLEVGDKWMTPQCLEGLAGVAAGQEPAEWAPRLLGAAEALREEFGVPISPPADAFYNRNLAAARAVLDNVSFAAAWRDGRQMTPEQAIAAFGRVPTRAQTIVLRHSETTMPSTRAPGSHHPAGLTDREVTVLHLVAAGLTDAQIAERLVISPRTVNSHLRSVYDKLGVSSRTGAMRYAVDHNLI